MGNQTSKSDNIEALLTRRRALSAAERQELRRFLAGLTNLKLAKEEWSNPMSRIGDEGACALAEALSGMTILWLTLNLERNGIGDEGACALAGALGHMPGLATLHLGYNMIGPKGARALAGALGDMPGLAMLDLRGNGIGAEGARALAGALGGMTGLASCTSDATVLRPSVWRSLAA